MVKLWRRLSERSDVRRKAPKAPKALKAGMKRQERPGANCSSMRSLISFGKVSSDVRCKKVSHALLPRQESSGSAFLESLRKHLQKLMPDSCIAMQNRHGIMDGAKRSKKTNALLGCRSQGNTHCVYSVLCTNHKSVMIDAMVQCR